METNTSTTNPSNTMTTAIANSLFPDLPKKADGAGPASVDVELESILNRHFPAPVEPFFSFDRLGGAPRHGPNEQEPQTQSLSELERMLFGTSERARMDYFSNIDGGKRECVVCYDEIKGDANTTDHRHFQFDHGGRCDHGKSLCSSCAEKVPQCPMCREVKPGMELALELSGQNGSGCSCIDAFRAESDSDDALELPVPSQSGDNSAEMETGTDNFLNLALESFVGNTDVEMGFDAEFQLISNFPSSPQAIEPPTLSPPVTSHVRDALDPVFAAPTVAPRSSARSSNRVRKSSVKVDLEIYSDNDTKNVLQTIQVSRSTPKARKTSVTKKSPSLTAKTPARPRKKTDTDNPFKCTRLTDEQVCDLPFNDIVKIMKDNNFTSEMIERGKKHRKRLKNRRQVMSYANRKRNNNEQTAEENADLESKISTLKTNNSNLSEENKQLSQEVRQKQTMSQATIIQNEMLKQQIAELTRRINAQMGTQ